MQEAVIRDADTRGVPRFHACPPDPSCPYCGGAAGPAPTGPGAFDWSFLDGAYCISLNSRPDRAASAASQFHRLGLCRLVTFHRPAAHGEAPKVGIWEAHRAVGMDALAKGLRAVLIMEDDVLFSPRVTPRTARRVGRALAGLPPGWTVFFLGHWPLRAWFVGRRTLRTVSGCAHAYVASRRLLEWLRDHPYGTAPIVRLVGHGIDAAYAALPGAYAHFPIPPLRAGHPEREPERPHPPLLGQADQAGQAAGDAAGDPGGAAVGADAAEPVRGGGTLAPVLPPGALARVEWVGAAELLDGNVLFGSSGVSPGALFI